MSILKEYAQEDNRITLHVQKNMGAGAVRNVGLRKAKGKYVAFLDADDRDDVPEREHYSISFYEIVNTENIGSCVVEKENFDLLKLVVIRLGDKVYNEKEGSKGYRLLRFLNAIMYPHDENFMDTISEYIDFSGNEELWKEKKNMFSMAQCIREDGIQAMVEENLEECIPEGRIIEKLQKYFKLPEEKAKAYYERFAQKL